MNIKYCLTCETEVPVFSSIGETPFHLTYNVDSWEIGSCYGLFFESPPPSLPEDWELHLTEPDAGELAHMNESANELLLSVGVNPEPLRGQNFNHLYFMMDDE